LEIIAIVVFVVSGVISSVALNTIMLLTQDMYHIFPESIARRLRMTGKTLSTSTLASQIIGLASSTILLIIPLSVFTVFVFTKDAKAVIRENGIALNCPAGLEDLCLPIIFSKISYSKFLLA
jgi:hypothetical protein